MRANGTTSRKVRTSLWAVVAGVTGAWGGVVLAECETEQAAVVVAEADVEAAEIALAFAEQDLASCLPGTCIPEHAAVNAAEADLAAALVALIAAEDDLEECQNQGSGKYPREVPIEPIPMVLDDAPLQPTVQSETGLVSVLNRKTDKRPTASP